MTVMTTHELIGRVAISMLRDELGDDTEGGGTARFLLDGLSVSQTAAVARGVLADTYLSPRIDVKLPGDLFSDAGLPQESLTDKNATYFRSAECTRAAYLVTNASGPESQAEEMSLHELTPIGAAQLLERMPAWVAAAGEHLGLDDEAKIWWEKALAGLTLLGSVSLDRFAKYVLAVRQAVEHDGHPILAALGSALPALQMPSDPAAFAGIKDRSRRHPSAWRREYAALRKRRRPYLLKETSNQIVLSEDELATAFGKAREAIPIHLHPIVAAFVESDPGWNESAEALAGCPWEQIKPLFEGLSREKFNLGADTLRFFEEGQPGLLSSDDEEYLSLLKNRQATLPDDSDILFYERHRDEIREERKLKSAWDKFIYGRPRETDDFLAGLAATMEVLNARAAAGTERRLRIRCDGATKRELRALNTEAGLHFALRYAGLASLFGPKVTWEVGSLFEFPSVLASWLAAKDKAASNRSIAKAALQLRFHVELDTTGIDGGVTTAAAQLVWKFIPDVISSQLVDDWGRLEEHPLLLGRASREPATAGRRAGAIDLSDVRTLVPAFDRDRGSLLPTYRKDRDVQHIWPINLKLAVADELISQDAATSLLELFQSFTGIYGNAITGFRVNGAGGNACREQARTYGRLLDAIASRAPGDRNRELLLRPILDLGQAPVADGPAAAIVAPWHPLRLAAMWRKATLVAEIVGKVVDDATGLEGDTKLFFRDLAADLAHPLYPEVVVSWSGRKPELLSFVDLQADYSLHEAPVLTINTAGEVNDDPGSGGACLLDLVQRYLALHPHERSNMSVVLFNCDSPRLPQQIVQGLSDIREEDDVRCQVMLRHMEPVRLREIYRSILAADDDKSDAYSASEATQDFMARLRISVIADQTAPPDPKDGRPYDIVFSQDVISRHAVLEWYSEAAEPADLDTLLPARWSRRRPAAADDLKSCVYLCCPVQSEEGWAHLSAVTSFLKGDDETLQGRRLLPVRQLDFRDDRTARIFEETHNLGAWVVNHDELLDRRQLQNQQVRVIRYKQAATQGRNVVISSRAPLNLLRAMVRKRLEELQLGLAAEGLDALAEKLIASANDVSGDIVLRAAKRGEAAGELIGVVLSRYLAHSAIGRDGLVGWYFLDDYAAWLGAREENQADILALAPSVNSDGQLHLTIVVTEAKYVEAASLSSKKKESEKQLRDTVRRIRDALAEEGRLDRESWLSRLGDLLLDGIQVPAANPVPLTEWRRQVREGLCSISIAGYSHVFVPTAQDGPSLSDFADVPNAPGCRQELYGRTELKALLLAYFGEADVTELRRSIDPLCASGLPNGTLIGVHGNTGEDALRASVEPPIAAFRSVGSETPLNASAGPEGTARSSSVPAHELPEESTSRAVGRKHGDETVTATIAKLIAGAPPEPEDDTEWLAQVALATRSALQQLSMQAKPVDQTLTPNAAILRFGGSANLTVEQVIKKRSELLTTHRLNVISVRPEPGAVAIYVARPTRRLVTIEQVWDRWRPTPSSNGNQNLVIGVREEDNELLVFSPGANHAPHTLIAGSTGSGKSVLMQSILLGIAVTNTPQQARIVLIDPKQGVDYFAFDTLPHLEGGIIDDQIAAAARLEALVAEMDRRYSLFKECRVPNLATYNSKVASDERLPAYWIIHDEFAEWMLTDEYRSAVTATVGRLGVKARAAGIYLIFAAQRPDANVVPMQLRSQLGNRLILRVDSEGTSEIALGERGAERLLGKGHMLVRVEGESNLIYAQAPFASEGFIEAIVAALAKGNESVT